MLFWQYFAQFADVQKSLDQEYRKQNRYLMQLKLQILKLTNFHEEKDTVDTKRIAAVKKYKLASTEETSASKKKTVLNGKLADTEKNLTTTSGDLKTKGNRLKSLEIETQILEALADKTMTTEIATLKTKMAVAKSERYC
jgi:hypothetical protein